MRKVMVSELVWKPRPDPQKGNMQVLVEKGVATFHAFGIDYEEFEGGPGHYTTAVIEWPNGTVDNVPVRNVRFLEGA